jgi:hypothetical protein
MAAKAKSVADIVTGALSKSKEQKKMGFISVPLDDVQESQPAPEAEYDLKIIKAVSGKSKAGTKMATITIAFDDTDAGDAPPFQHYLRDPGDIADEDQSRMAALEAKRFAAVFDLPEDWDVDDLQGETGNCFVSQETGSDDIVRNRLRLPRLKD